VRWELVEAVEGMLRHAYEILRIGRRYRSFHRNAHGKDWLAYLYDVSNDGTKREAIHTLPSAQSVICCSGSSAR
jgi:hypothetical protein